MTLAIGSPIKQLLRIAVSSDQSVLLRGGTGVGKSQIVVQAAKDLGIGYITRDLSLMEPSDLVGMPEVRNGRTHFAPPAFLPASGAGILMFEELNRAPPYMLAPTLELLTARALNDYRLPAGWLLVAAINPDDDDAYIGTKTMDAALLARFMIIDVEASVKEWGAWAKGNAIDPRVISYVTRTPKVFGSTRSNPRAWSAVSRVLVALEAAEWDPNLAMNCLTGLVGEDMAMGFIKSLTMKESAVPSARNILENYARHQKAVKKLAKANDTAPLFALVEAVLLLLQDPGNRTDAELTRTRMDNVERFISDLPAEHRRIMRENLDQGLGHAV